MVVLGGGAVSCERSTLYLRIVPVCVCDPPSVSDTMYVRDTGGLGGFYDPDHRYRHQDRMLVTAAYSGTSLIRNSPPP